MSNWHKTIQGGENSHKLIGTVMFHILTPQAMLAILSDIKKKKRKRKSVLMSDKTKEGRSSKIIIPVF